MQEEEQMEGVKEGRFQLPFGLVFGTHPTLNLLGGG